MTITAPPRPPRQYAPEDLEALMEEARRRARRRRRRNGVAAALVAAAGVGLFLTFGNGGGGGALHGQQAQLPAVARSNATAHTAVAARNGPLTILGGKGIALVDPAGKVRTLVPCGPRARCAAYPFSVDWAPDGRRIAYSVSVGPGATGDRAQLASLHVLDTVTRTDRRIASGIGISDLDWSPDGSRLAYVRDGNISVIRADGTGQRLVPIRTSNEGWSPSWAPDGRRIAFSGPRNGLPWLYVVRVDHVITARATPLAPGEAPAWSPDGRTIAYRAKCGRIKLMTPRGTDVTPASVLLRCRSVGVSGTPVWSPDGRELAISKRTGSAAYARPGIYVMNVDGSNLHLVTTELSRNFAGGGRPTWRPIPLSRRTRHPLFAYDRSAPLDIVRGPTTVARGVARQNLAFNSTHSARLHAYFVHPVSGGPWPLVIWSPGNGGDRREQLPQAVAAARLGVASLLVDPPTRELVTCKPADDLRSYVDYVVGRRRAIDVAARLKNVDSTRIAAAGFSFGASVTATLSGVDHRLAAVALASGRAHHTGFMRIVCASLATRRLNAYVTKLGVVDPVHWLGLAAATPLLMQNGTHDPWTTRSDAHALYAAARGPKEIRWYSAGHELDPRAWAYQRQWLLGHLRRP